MAKERRQNAMLVWAQNFDYTEEGGGGQCYYCFLRKSDAKRLSNAEVFRKQNYVIPVGEPVQIYIDRINLDLFNSGKSTIPGMYECHVQDDLKIRKSHK